MPLDHLTLSRFACRTFTYRTTCTVCRTPRSARVAAGFVWQLAAVVLVSVVVGIVHTLWVSAGADLRRGAGGRHASRLPTVPHGWLLIFVL